MISRVKDFEIGDQSYVEELIRQVLPKVKINNVVPWSFVIGNKSGADAYVKGFLYNPNVMYFGTFQGSPSLTIYAFDAPTLPPGITMSSGGYPSPVLFSNLEFGVAAPNSKMIVFTGWKITLENEAINPAPPTPPLTPPAFEGFQAFYSWDVVTNGGGSSRGVFGAEIVNRDCFVKVYRLDTGAFVEDTLLLKVREKLFTRFGADSHGIGGLAFEFFEADGGAFIERIEYANEYRFPLDHVVTKPAAMNPVPYQQNSTGIFENLTLVEYFPFVKQGNPYASATHINTGVVTALNVVADTGVAHTTVGNYMGSVLHFGLNLTLKFTGGANQVIDLARVIP